MSWIPCSRCYCVPCCCYYSPQYNHVNWQFQKQIKISDEDIQRIIDAVVKALKENESRTKENS